ncbi:MAG TPA: formyltetrahydrofolate deformylase [Gaiellaceae bacterium]
MARLIVACPDRPGIIAALSRLLAENGANIISSDQYSTDPEGGRFFLRMEIHLEELAGRRPDLEAQLAAVAGGFAMDWRLTVAEARQRVALFASRDDHCVLDLLWRRQRGELDAEIVAVVSNHPDLEQHVLPFGVPYYHVAVDPARKAAAEQESLDLLAGEVELVVLARYMQVLSGDFLRRVGAPVINIHHSFLPAFAGAAPYAQAHERGVKLIGATAHYATEELDEGPIIEQGVARVTHRDTPAELARIGRDLERVVLARAVQWHLEDRVIVDGNRTIVF